MRHKNLSIRLAVIDGQKVESTFERIGQRGDKALDKITHATRPASRGLKDVDAAARMLNNTLRQAAGLIGVYIGLSSAMQGLRSVADTGMAFEGLNNALLAVAGSSSAAAAELGYIEQESERLGLNLATTAQAYLQLAAASKGTNLQGQATREIFTAVAEASTVLQLSADQTSGALRAIGQIMSKGKVQAEELRGQLGERLYGAFQLAARGMGITTMELDKMLEQGQLIADEFLPRFADEIQRTFSDGVAVASKSARAELNRFSNSVLEIERQIAANGFLEGLTEGLRGLTTTLKDPTVLQAAADLGEALGVAIKGAADALGFLVRNADLAVTAVGGLIIARTAAAAFAGLNTVLATNGTIVGLKAVADISTGLAVRLAVLQGATSLATVAIRGFGAALAFVGGPVGLAVLAGVALYKMASGHDVATKAARDHADELAELKAAAQGAADGVEALNEATANEAFFRYEEQLRTAKENIIALKKELTLGAVGGFWDQLRRTGTPLQADLVALRRELLNGRISAEEYSDAIFALARKYPSFGEQAQDIREQVLALQAAELAAKNATAALDGLSNPQAPDQKPDNKPNPKLTGTSSNKDAAKDYERAQQRIKEQIAALAAQEQALRRLTAAREDGAAAMAAALLLNEQENTLRQLGLSLTESEGTVKAKQASQIKELVASIQALKQAETAYQDEQKASEKLARQRMQTVEDVRKRYAQLDTTLAGAIERAKAWRTEAMAGLDETAQGYAEFRQQVDAVFNQMLKDAWDEDLRNSKRWRDGVTRALQDVSDAASDRAAQMENLVSNAFRGMEDALVDFVQTGKLDFKSLADSIIADLIRMQIQASITGPLAAALNAGIGSVFGAPGGTAAGSTAAPVAHTGGVIGSDALPSRMVSTAVFESAPRFHGGGVVGSEVPIIAQRGEAVLTPGQMAMLGGAIRENQLPNITVHIHNNTGTQTEARTEVTRQPGGGLSLDIILEQMQGDMARNISRGEGLAPTLERRYGLNPAAGSYR